MLQCRRFAAEIKERWRDRDRGIFSKIFEKVRELRKFDIAAPFVPEKTQWPFWNTLTKYVRR